MSTPRQPPVGFPKRISAYARQICAELAGSAAHQTTIRDMLAQSQPVFLSPHHDDICFSLGALALRLKRGVLIDLFTRSRYVADGVEGEILDVQEVTQRREEEDRRFAERCGLQRLDLGLDEPPLKGRAPFDEAGVADDCVALAKPLVDCLMALEAPDDTEEQTMLFCPAAIGGHANHLATMLTVVEALPTLSRRFRVLFYEDLHYASSRRRRRAGLARLFSIMGPLRPVRHVIPLGTEAQAKLDSIRLYRSQFTTLPENLRRFTPRTWVPTAPHEAFWEFAER
jgi:LmbE family N-acetylglucosaminyl deacetylase